MAQEKEEKILKFDIRDWIYLLLLLISAVGVFYKSQSDISLLNRDIQHIRMQFEEVKSDTRKKFDKQDEKLELILTEIKAIRIELAKNGQ